MTVSNGTIIDNDSILTEGIPETITVVPSDPRGLHDFSTDNNWTLTAEANKTDCNIPTSSVCFTPVNGVCENSGAITVVGYHNPNIADDPTFDVYYKYDDCEDALIDLGTWKIVPPTITIDPATVYVTNPATTTHVVFKVVDAHGYGIPDVAVAINGQGVSASAGGYTSYAPVAYTSDEGEADWFYPFNYSGNYKVAIQFPQEEYCEVPCGWNTLEESGTITAVFKAPEPDTEAPVITINNPKDNDVVETNTVTVSGTVTDNAKVDSLYINGKKVDFRPDGSFDYTVTLDAGTGCVHTAPGHGEDDYFTGLKYNLEPLSPVDDTGHHTKEAGKYAGMHVKDSNKLIIEDLKEMGYLVYHEKYKHSYPHCWRCKEPLIFRATEQWFMAVEHNDLRNKALKSTDDVKWVPEWGKKRISGMLESRPDWCISRQRSWGIPIPAIKCKDCGEVILDPKVMDKFISFVEKEGTNSWFSRPIQDFLPDDYKCEKCGGSNFEKTYDILDVWIDSGCSYQYMENYRDYPWPADLYLEGSDQHRGWFQSSMLMSLMSNKTLPYKQVLTHGFVNDDKGKKMSKSLGNVVTPQEIIDKYGADILRMWVASTDYRNDVKLSMKMIKQYVESYRKIRNTLRFILQARNVLHQIQLQNL
jgi:hypothetical protein